MRRSSLALLVCFALTGVSCDDDSNNGKADADKKKAEAEKTIKFVEESAEDPAKFGEVMKQAAKARVLAWGDAALLQRIEEASTKARTARSQQLEQLWAKAHQAVESALAKTDPADSEKVCQAALQQLDGLAPPVAAHGGAKVDDDRKALVERIDAARRANEIIAKAKDLGEESGTKARAFVRSFELVPSLKASPFQAQVLALLTAIPDKPGAGAAGASGGEEIVLFDGSNDAQITYFEKEHNWVWNVPKPPEEPVLLADNSESASDTSTIWVGDDSWGDLIADIQFNVGDGALLFHVRQKDEQSFDSISLPDVKIGEWAAVRIELRGDKAIIRLNGEKSEVALQHAKGAFGITVPPMGRVKVRTIKIRLLDKDAKKPQMHEQKATDDDDKTDNPKKKKKKKPGG